MLYDGVVMTGLLMLAAAIALPFGNTQKIAFENIGFTIWLLTVCFAYLGSCWHFAGMTVGMRAWRVRLVSENGRCISWPQCLMRFFVGIISLMVFGLGIIWAWLDTGNRGWHDLASHTLLVRSNQGGKPH
jgi:uncharacterized RDD family membrane protein YckC